MEDSVVFENPKYYIIDTIDGVTRKGIRATVNGTHISFLCKPQNKYYAEIMRQVDAGELVIAEAE